MKILYLFLGLVLCVALSGCGKSKLVTENERLKQQLDSTTQKADKAESDLKAASLQIEAQKQSLEALTNRISDFQKDKDKMDKDKEKMEKDLEIYRGKATEAIEDIKALDGILHEDNLDTATYTQHYIDTKIEVTKLVSSMSESEVGKRIISLLDDCDSIKNALENKDSDIKQAEESENEAYHNDLMLSRNDYDRAYQKYNHSNILAKKIYDIKVNLAGTILKSGTQLAVDIFNVQTLMTTGSVQKI